MNTAGWVKCKNCGDPIEPKGMPNVCQWCHWDVCGSCLVPAKLDDVARMLERKCCMSGPSAMEVYNDESSQSKGFQANLRKARSLVPA